MRRALGLSRLSDLLGLAVAGAAVLVGVLLIAAGIEVTRAIISVSSDPLRDAELRVLPAQTPATGVAGMLARGQRVNVLLLGYGGAGHDGAFLTDSLMVASLDPPSRVTLLSVPRDLWATFPKSKYAASYSAKVNEAFAIPAANGDRDEGIRVADATLESALGIQIHRTVAIDFRAFRTVVDAIGGIDIVVDRSFTALYPKNDDPDVDPSWIEISFRAGTQHMDGEAALRYARARYSDSVEGSDFARSQRQQKVILAAKDRAIATNAVSQLLGLIAALRDNVRTDLSLSDLQALAAFARGYDDTRTVKAALTTENVLQSGYSEDTGYALWPKVEGFGDVHTYVRRVLDYPKSLSEDPQVILAVSRRRAFAGEQAARRLEDLGFRVQLEFAEGDDPGRTTISDGTGGSGDWSALFLAAYFGDALITDPGGTGSILVHLGRDWQPPTEFDAPNETPKPEPDASPTPVPSGPPRPSASPGRSRVPATSPTKTPRPTRTPKR